MDQDEFAMSNSAREYDRARGIPPERPRPLAHYRTLNGPKAVHAHEVHGLPPQSVIDRLGEWWERPHPVLGALVCIAAACALGFIAGAWWAW